MLTNSSLLTLGSASAAGLGFAYWWLAARVFPPAAVGAQSALISAMAFVGLLGEAGFGTLLVGMALTQGDRAQALIIAAVLAGAGAALAVALPAAWLLHYLGWMGVPVAVLFAIGCALTGLGLVLDQAFVGLLRSRLQLYRSVLFSILKLLMLAGAAALTQDQNAILLTWIAALSLSLVVSWRQSWRAGVLDLVTPDFQLLAAQVPTVIDHHLLNLAASGPMLIVPLVVRLCLGPAVNAAFYAGWMIVTVGLMVPASLTTVLFTLGTAAPSTLPRRLRLSALISLLFGLAVAAVLATFPDTILGVFNPAYPALAAPAVRLLGLGMLGGAVKQHYILLARLRRKMLTGALWLGLGGCFEVGLAALGGTMGGVQWLTIGWLVPVTVQAGFLLRPVLRSALAARAASPAEQSPAIP